MPCVCSYEIGGKTCRKGWIPSQPTTPSSAPRRRPSRHSWTSWSTGVRNTKSKCQSRDDLTRQYLRANSSAATVARVIRFFVTTAATMGGRPDSYGDCGGSNACWTLTLLLPFLSSIPNRYAAVLADCQACYFAQRQELTAPIIYAKMAELNRNHINDLPTWVR